jgi:hypothetical protein
LRGRKKSTNIPVYKNEEGYNLKEGAPIGNLKILFHTPQDVYYTDNYTKLERYYIGVENRMSRDGVDLDKRNTCSTGYHSGGAGFAYKGFGDTPVAVVLNPKDVIVVYENSYGKCRSSAFTVVGVLKEDAQWANDKDILEEIENVSRNTFTDFHQLLEMFENGELTIDNTKWSKEEIDFARSVIDPKEILSNLDVSNYNLGEYK